jgi:hypothetical protein
MLLPPVFIVSPVVAECIWARVCPVWSVWMAVEALEDVALDGAGGVEDVRVRDCWGDSIIVVLAGSGKVVTVEGWMVGSCSAVGVSLGEWGCGEVIVGICEEGERGDGWEVAWGGWVDVGGRAVSVEDCRVASGREGGALSMLEDGGEAREGGEVREGECGVGEWREEAVMGSGGGECAEVRVEDWSTEGEVTWGGVVSEGGEADEDETGPAGSTAISPGRSTATSKGFESFSV